MDFKKALKMKKNMKDYSFGRKCLSFVVLSFLAVLSCSQLTRGETACISGGNLLDNASFEVDGDTNRVPDLWDVKEQGQAVVKMTEDAHSGSNALNIQVMGEKSSGVLSFSKKINVKNVNQLFISLFYKTPQQYAETFNVGSIRLLCYDKNGKSLGIVGSGMPIGTRGEWRCVRYCMDLRKFTETIHFSINVSNHNEMDLTIDDIYVGSEAFPERYNKNDPEIVYTFENMLLNGSLDEDFNVDDQVDCFTFSEANGGKHAWLEKTELDKYISLTSDSPDSTSAMFYGGDGKYPLELEKGKQYYFHMEYTNDCDNAEVIITSKDTVIKSINLDNSAQWKDISDKLSVKETCLAGLKIVAKGKGKVSVDNIYLSDKPFSKAYLPKYDPALFSNGKDYSGYFKSNTIEKVNGMNTVMIDGKPFYGNTPMLAYSNLMWAEDKDKYPFKWGLRMIPGIEPDDMDPDEFKQKYYDYMQRFLDTTEISSMNPPAFSFSDYLLSKEIPPIDGMVKFYSEVMAFIFKTVKDPKLVLMIKSPFTSEAFATNHPDDIIRYNMNGGLTYPVKFEACNRPLGSMASETARHAYHKRLEFYLDNVLSVEEGKYAKNIWAVFLLPGYSDGHWYHNTIPKNVYGMDASKAMCYYFRKYCFEKYGADISLLRKAWKGKNINFDTIQVPNYYEINLTENILSDGYFTYDRKSQDFYEAFADAKQTYDISLMRYIKQRSGGKLLAGGYDSYTLACSRLNAGLRYKRLFNSKYVNLIASAGVTLGPGQLPGIVMVDGAVSLRDDKIIFTERDTRVHGANSTPYIYEPKDNKDDVATFSKQMGYFLTKGFYVFWNDFGAMWYDKPHLMDTFKKFEKIYKTSLAFSKKKTADIVLVYDENAPFAIRGDIKIGDRFYRNIFARMRNYETGNAGAPFDFMDLNDLLEMDHVPDYKMYIFLGAFDLDNRERQLIDAKLKKNGKTLVWMYGSGYCNPDQENPADVEYMKSLTGFSFKREDIPLLMPMKVSDQSPVLNNEIKPGDTILNHEHVLYSGYPGPSRKPDRGKTPYRRPPLGMRPAFYVDNASPDEVIGRYQANNQAGFAVKQFDDWTSVYCGLYIMPSRFIRQLARNAGVHIYNGDDNVIAACESFLMVNTVKAGPLKIDLPKKCDVYDLMNDRIIGKDIDSFTIDADFPATYVYFTGDVDQWLKVY